VAEHVDDPLQLLARRRQAWYSVTRLRSCGARQLRALEPAKTIHQQRARDARQPAIEIVEVPNAREQLANDQRRPAIGEDLGGARDGASTLRPADLVR